MSSPQSVLPGNSDLSSHNRHVIVMESKVRVKHVFQQDRAYSLLHDENADPQPNQSAQPEPSLVCCSCLKIRPSLLVGECACLVCSNCWAGQNRSLHCTHCDMVVKYIKLDKLLKFPAMGKMGELFLTEEAFGNIRVAELTNTIKKQQKMQDYVSKILDKQNAAWERKMRLEKAELKKTQRNMKSLSKKISSKLESIALLEEAIKNLHMNESSRHQERVATNHFVIREENLQDFGTTRQRVQVPPPSKEFGQGQAMSREMGQVPSTETGQASQVGSGQDVLVPSRLSSQVLAFSRTRRQVSVPIRQVQVQSNRTEEVSALSWPVVTPDLQARQALSSSSQVDKLLLPRPKHVRGPKKLAGQIEKQKNITQPGQAQQVRASTQPQQASKLSVLNGCSRQQLLGKLSLSQVSSANSNPVKEKDIPRPAGQCKTTLPTYKPPHGSRLLTQTAQSVSAVAQQKTSGDYVPAVIQQKTVDQTKPAITQQKTAGYSYAAFTQQKPMGYNIPAVTQHMTSHPVQISSGPPLIIQSKQFPPASMSTHILTQRQDLPANTDQPSLINPGTAGKESVVWSGQSRQPSPAVRADPLLHSRRDKEVRDAVRRTEVSLEACRVSDKKEDARSRDTITDIVEDEKGVTNNSKLKRKWKLASGVEADLAEMRKVIPNMRRRKVIPVPSYQ